MSTTTLNGHIETTPGVAGGKPRIAGRRITVENIVIWHDRLGLSPDAIADEYGLELSDVYAALTYYHDHRDAVDERMRQGEAFVESLRAATPSLVLEKLAGRASGG